MITKPTYAEIANSFALWMEYVDPSGHDTQEKFDSMSTEEKIAFQEKCFGPEASINTYDYATDSEQGEIEAESVEAAYAQLRSKITPAMIEDGATLWVEPQDPDSTEDRLTLGQNAE